MRKMIFLIAYKVSETKKLYEIAITYIFTFTVKILKKI